MPYAPLRPCSYPGCRTLVKHGRCPAHKRVDTKRLDALRGTAHERGYNTRWQKFRLDYLKHHPMCVLCEKVGRLTFATVVDHITPHRGDMAIFWRRGNHQSLCAQCHNSVKRREENRGAAPGSDTSGLPMDPKHHWNR